MESTKGFNNYYLSLGKLTLSDFRQFSFSFPKAAKNFPSLGSSSCYQKLTAVPQALYAVALAIGHAVYSIFGLFSENGFRTHIFLSARNFQEAWGRLVTIVDNTLGSSIVEKALFHQAYYRFCPIAKKTPNKPIDFQNMPLEELKGLDLAPLTTTECDALLSLNLEAKLRELSFNQITILLQKASVNCSCTLIGNHSDEINALFNRMSGQELSDFLNAFPYDTSSIKATAIVNKLQLTHIAKLDLSKLSAEQLTAICNRYEPADLFAVLSDPALQIVVEKVTGVTDPNFYNAVPMDRIPALDFKKFTPDIIEKILNNEPFRFQEVSTPVSDWTYWFKLENLDSLSDEQLRAIDLTTLGNAGDLTNDPYRQKGLVRKIPMMSVEELTKLKEVLTPSGNIILLKLLVKQYSKVTIAQFKAMPPEEQEQLLAKFQEPALNLALETQLDPGIEKILTFEDIPLGPNDGNGEIWEYAIMPLDELSKKPVSVCEELSPMAMDVIRIRLAAYIPESTLDSINSPFTDIESCSMEQFYQAFGMHIAPHMVKLKAWNLIRTKQFLHCDLKDLTPLETIILFSRDDIRKMIPDLPLYLLQLIAEKEYTGGQLKHAHFLEDLSEVDLDFTRISKSTKNRILKKSR